MVAKFCSRSHGQPVPGVRSAAMISSSRAMSREGFMGHGERYQARSGRRDQSRARPTGMERARTLMPDRCLVARRCWRRAPPRTGTRSASRSASIQFSIRLAVATSSWSSADLVRLAHGLGDLLVVVHQLAQHHRAGGTKSVVVVLDASAAWRYGRSSAASCRRSCGRARPCRRWRPGSAAACSSSSRW